jgi:Mitochondrial carrier protein
VADEGFLALYKGLTPTLLGLGHVMLQFPVYEHIKAKLSNHREEDLRPAHILIASSLSKILASGVFYGHEVIRVRIQLDSRVSPGVSEPVRMARLPRIWNKPHSNCTFMHADFHELRAGETLRPAERALSQGRQREAVGKDR